MRCISGFTRQRSHLCRSLTISLAIVIAITETPACSFIIRRTNTTTDSISDLKVEESTLVETRYDVGSLNVVKAFQNKKDVESTTPNKTVNIIEEDKLLVNLPVVNQTGIVNDTSISPITPKSLKEKGEIAGRLNFLTTFQNKTDDQLITDNKTLNIITKDKLIKSLPEVNQTGHANDITTIMSSELLNVNGHDVGGLNVVGALQNENYNELTMGNNTWNIIKEEKVDENISENQIGDANDTSTIMSTEVLRVNITDNVDTFHYSDATESTVLTTENSNNLTQYIADMETTQTSASTHFVVKEKVKDFEKDEDKKSIMATKLTTLKLPDIYDSSTITTADDGSSGSLSKTKLLNVEEISRTIPEIVQTNHYVDLAKTEIPITTEIITTMNPSYNTETFETTGTNDYVTIPTNHTTLTTEYPSLVSNVDMIKIETARRSPDIFLLPPIPSHEEVGPVPSSKTDVTTQVISKAKNIITEDNSNSLEFKSINPPQIKVTKAMSTKLEMVVSKRGGYIINTEATPLHQTQKAEEKTTTDEYLNNIDPSFTGPLGTIHESDFDIDGIDNKNASSGVESQRQLVEDAIKEELLEEKRLHEYEESIKRYSENGINSLVAAIRNSSKNEEVATEDALRVKPVYDKKINTSLYAVNPNYKPLKKIEVQPPKQFLRNPDDNSWRNESISSLGIVFKPKNSSKSFTQVLKNKTEIEFNNTPDKENKGEIPDLRVRLEKMAEVRKSKKKKINKFGDVVYTDYEENSGENTSSPSVNSSSTTSSTPFLSIFKQDYLENRNKKVDTDKIINNIGPIATKKPKKIFNIAEYYDTSDEYESDYAKLAKIDIKKYTLPNKSKVTPSIQPPESVYTTPLSNYVHDRQPTVQYFPPTKKVTQKVNMNDYDGDFRRKINLYTFNETPKNVLTVPHGTVSPSHTKQFEAHTRTTMRPTATPIYKSNYHNKNLYLSDQTQITVPPEIASPDDGAFDRGSYVIKHYRDFINEAVKANDEDEAMGILPATESPIRGVTIDELAKLTEKDSKSPDEEYDYDSHFRKEVISRFVDNFNQHSDRFKVDFPILYNSSVVHQQIYDKGKGLASSTAFLKRQYGVGRPGFGFMPPRACDPHCDKATSVVELSPEYELHYYVPEQEEREEMEQKPIIVPYSNKNLHL